MTWGSRTSSGHMSAAQAPGGERSLRRPSIDRRGPSPPLTQLPRSRFGQRSMMMSLLPSYRFVLGTAVLLSLVPLPTLGQSAPQQSRSGTGAPLEEGLIRLQTGSPADPTGPAAAGLRMEAGD